MALAFCVFLTLAGPTLRGPTSLLDFGLLVASPGIFPGFFVPASFLESLILGLLNESSDSCFVALPTAATGLLPLRANMRKKRSVVLHGFLGTRKFQVFGFVWGVCE